MYVYFLFIFVFILFSHGFLSKTHDWLVQWEIVHIAAYLTQTEGIKYTADNSLYPSSEKQDNIPKNKPKKKVLDLLDLLQGNIWNELMFKDSR